MSVYFSAVVMGVLEQKSISSFAEGTMAFGAFELRACGLGFRACGFGFVGFRFRV